MIFFHLEMEMHTINEAYDKSVPKVNSKAVVIERKYDVVWKKKL